MINRHFCQTRYKSIKAHFFIVYLHSCDSNLLKQVSMCRMASLLDTSLPQETQLTTPPFTSSSSSSPYSSSSCKESFEDMDDERFCCPFLDALRVWAGGGDKHFLVAIMAIWRLNSDMIAPLLIGHSHSTWATVGLRQDTIGGFGWSGAPAPLTTE